MQRRVLFFYCTALVILLSLPLWSEEPRQTIEDNSLEDSTYGFVLNRPSADWGFLEEKTIRRFDADALAGLYHDEAKAYTVVALDNTRQGLKFYLADMSRRLGLKRARVQSTEIRAAPASGKDARQGRVRLSGLKDGQPRSYMVTVLPRGASYYRLVSWWPGKGESPVRSDLERIHENFSVSGDTEVVRKITPDPYEMVGVGWEVRNNFYQNAILGVSAALPRSDWRFLGSQELRELNPQAAMGMEHVDGVYLILVAEKLGGIDWSGYEDSVVESMKSEIKYWGYEKREVTLMAQKRNLHIFERASVPDSPGGRDYGIIVSTAETYGYQWFAWWPAGSQAKALAALDQAYSQFSYMDWARQKRLRRSLLKFASRPRSVHGKENFRNLTYRHHATGVTLKLPPGFWEHRLDANSGLFQDGGSPGVSLENITSGLYLATRHESCRLKPAAYHAKVLKDMGDARVLSKRVLGERNGPIYSTRIRPAEDSGFVYHVATAVRGTVCLQLSMWGYAKNLRTTVPLENRVLAGLSVTGRPIPEVRDTRREYADYRMGFAVRKPAGWTFDPLPGAEDRESSFLSASGPGGAVIIGAIQDALEPRGLPEDFADHELLRGVELEEPLLRTTTWLGQDAQLLVFPGKRGPETLTVEVLVTGVGGSNFFMLSASPSRPAIPAALQGGFRLLK